MGRKRINMERIADKRKRHVTFSKRRNGLFKKAQEICSLTGATIAIVCFSEAGRPFTFCHPPSAKDDGGDDHQRVLSIMQQYYESSGGCTITAAPFQSAPVGEPKSTGEYQNNMATDLPQLASDDERMWASIEPLYASSIDASHGIVPISSFGGENQQEMRLLPQLQSMHEKEAALLQPARAQPVEEGLVDSSSCGSVDLVSTNSCCYSWPSPPPLSSIEALFSPSSSSLRWNNDLDFLEMGAEEYAIMPSTFFSSF